MTPTKMRELQDAYDQISTRILKLHSTLKGLDSHCYYDKNDLGGRLQKRLDTAKILIQVAQPIPRQRCDRANCLCDIPQGSS